MINGNSLPTIEQANRDKFLGLLQQGDPELYLIKLALTETGVNPLILVPIIRAISTLMFDDSGKVSIFIERRVVTQVRPEIITHLHEPVMK